MIYLLISFFIIMLIINFKLCEKNAHFLLFIKLFIMIEMINNNTQIKKKMERIEIPEYIFLLKIKYTFIEFF